MRVVLTPCTVHVALWYVFYFMICFVFAVVAMFIRSLDLVLLARAGWSAIEYLLFCCCRSIACDIPLLLGVLRQMLPL